MTSPNELERGRACYADEAWASAYESLCRADLDASLQASDLELLARSAYMVGRDDDYRSSLERAHRLYRDAGDVPRAVRCAFWIGHNLMFRGEHARAAGWFARGQRLIDSAEADCVERGYLLIPVWLEQMGRGDYEAGYATAAEAAAIGEHFGDADLVWLSVDEQSRALVNQGQVEAGLRLANEVLIAASDGELSPLITGIVYCNTIAFCHRAYEFGHAREWTDALARWCARQPEMVAHNGLCLVHRAEIMQLQGAWEDALDEARRAADRFTNGVLNQLACGKAHYRQGEVHRLRGELGAAESAYRQASRCGCEPQPGLGLLRLAQGNPQAGATAIRRALTESIQPLQRVALLPSYVEVLLALGDVDGARQACRELGEISRRQGSDAIAAMSAQARGATALADGDASGALVLLREASRLWHALEAPYEAARTRVLLGLACRVLEDEDSALLEFAAARDAFGRLGAARDLVHVRSVTRVDSPNETHGLTAREVQVLRLVAEGRSNREIAAELILSEHTVRRHLQNIFRKLGVTTRTAATSFALQHDLI